MFADWGFQNRTTALRVSAPGRFEYRSVDSSVNPYLSFAAIIKAMEDGITRNLDPGPPEERNIYDAIAGGKNVKRVPMNPPSLSWNPCGRSGPRSQRIRNIGFTSVCGAAAGRVGVDDDACREQRMLEILER